jgi:hypothetical protein
MEGQGMKDAFRHTAGRGQHIVHSRPFSTKSAPQVQVTLSVELLNHLRLEAQSMHVPLRWLVAGLVCDTMNAGS